MLSGDVLVSQLRVRLCHMEVSVRPSWIESMTFICEILLAYVNTIYCKISWHSGAADGRITNAPVTAKQSPCFQIRSVRTHDPRGWVMGLDFSNQTYAHGHISC